MEQVPIPTVIMCNRTTIAMALTLLATTKQTPINHGQIITAVMEITTRTTAPMALDADF